MQCFGGCFATKHDEHTTSWSAVEDSDVIKGCKQDAASKFRASSTNLKASPVKASTSSKFRLLRSSSSTKQHSGPTYTPAQPTTAEDRERLRKEFLLAHGRHILGISTLQQEQLQHFIMPGIGYIGFAWMQNGFENLGGKKTAVALSDPVCARHHFRTMAEAFIKEHPEAMFVQVSFEFAEVLQTLDFTCNSMGGETRLDLATYDFTGYARRGLRSAIQSATKDGLTVEEVMHPEADTFGSNAVHGAGAVAAAAAGKDWSQLSEELSEINAVWSESKGGRANDVWFINRPPVFAPEAGVRKFVARNSSGQVQGFIFFDSVYENGQLSGYYANVTRMRPDAHPGTLNLIMKEFIHRARAERQLTAPVKKVSMRKSQRKKLEAAAAGATPTAAETPAGQQQQSSSTGPTFVSLGMSPFYQMNNKPRPGWKWCKMTYYLLVLSYEDGAEFYPFKTLAAAKAKYGAGLHNYKYDDPNVEWRNCFLCHNRKGIHSSFWGMFDLAKLYGFWRDPADCFGRYLNYKGKQGAQLMAKGLKKAASLDTYKPKGKGLKRSVSTSCVSTSSSVSSTTQEAGMRRSKSSPSTVACSDAINSALRGKKDDAASASGVSAAAGATAAAVTANIKRAPSDASLIGIAANASPRTESSASDRASNVASSVCENTNSSTDDNANGLSSSDSDSASA